MAPPQSNTSPITCKTQISTDPDTDIESFWEGLRPPRSPETQPQFIERAREVFKQVLRESPSRSPQRQQLVRGEELEQQNQELQELRGKELRLIQQVREAGLPHDTLPTVINLLEGLVTRGCNQVSSFPKRVKGC